MQKRRFIQLLIIAIAVTSCSREIGTNNDVLVPEPRGLRILPQDYSAQTLVDSSGLLHNQILHHLYSNASSNLSNQQFSHYLVSTANTFVMANYGFPSLPGSYQAAMESDILMLLSNNYHLLRKENMDSIMNAALSAAISHRLVTNSTEIQILENALDIFDVDSTWSESVALDSIASRAERLLQTYNQHAWLPGEGHLAGGFLNIAKSSAEYWKQHYANTDPQKLPNFIRRWGWPQFDAAGYLVGWTKAWAWDELDTQKKRIGAGLSNAADWSGISSLFK
jgi:hypothetical protein